MPAAPYDPVLIRNHARFHGMRIGLLGGSFNPAHAGHVHISQEAIKRLNLDAVWWLVSPQNPLKSSVGMAPAAVRLRHARTLAPPRVWASLLEEKLGTRATWDTLKALKGYHPRVRFVWLMGGDSLANFHLWHRWRDIPSLMPIAVLSRPGYEGACWSTPAGGWFGARIRPRAQARSWAHWRIPALVIVSFPLTAQSATAHRAAEPNWASRDTATGAGAIDPMGNNRLRLL